MKQIITIFFLMGVSYSTYAQKKAYWQAKVDFLEPLVNKYLMNHKTYSIS